MRTLHLFGEAIRLTERLVTRTRCYEKCASYTTIANKRDISCDNLYSCNIKHDIQKQDLSPEDFYNKIIFANNKIVAINKPCGISVHGKRHNSTSDAGEKSNQQSSTIHQHLPHLSHKLQCPELEVGLSLKSYYSGVMLLCKDHESKKKLEKCIAGAGAQKQQFMSYLAITLGVPVCPHNVPLEAYISREFLHNRELSIISPKDIHSARKEGSMILINFSVKPLIVNKDTATSLVEVSINKDRWDAVEVLMSHYLSPVLGDHIYSSRTYSVMGVPFSASPYMAPPSTQKVPQQVLEALAYHGHFAKDEPLPLFMHRYKVTLKNFPVKKSPPLVITGAPQNEFLHALQCLGLYDPSIFL